ncbi:hypothetical protein [uncultured Nocardioides sp.]|uniref:hypothetical protein n=1 Tax=uncultured Nocardioides sp. TaxID=198441 RepID=UPI0026369702|nr:hypothetical protein [uncultured Nocardioides sp.]
MVCDVTALTVGSPDPDRLAAFWGGLLTEDVSVLRGAPALVAPDGVGFALRFVLHPSTFLEGRPFFSSLAGDGLADPGGNELCVVMASWS